MESFVFASSSMGLPIFGFTFKPKSPAQRKVLILGGVHGNEPEGVACAFALMGSYIENFPFKNLELVVVPSFNMEGVLSGSRLNGNSVDLNRNLPTKDWNPKSFSPKYPPGEKANSESENQELVRWLDVHQPKLIISIHSFEKFMMNINGECREVAEAMKSVNAYPIEESIGYPTPGCLGTYAGLEREMPTITYEIQRGLPTSEILKVHVKAIQEGLQYFDRKEFE